MDDTMKRPPSFVLADDDAKAFADLTARQLKLTASQKAVRDMMKAHLQAEEARLSEINVDTQKLGVELQKLWERVGKKHGIDLTMVAYDVSDDGKSLVPLQMRFKPS